MSARPSRHPTRVVLRQMLKERVRSTLWWSLAVAVLTLAVGFSFAPFHENASDIDAIMESMPEGMSSLLGAANGLASPAGFLNSQFYSNIFPIVLLVFGVAAAAWTIAGAEREGTLEPLLANPVRRSRVALGRWAGVALLLAVLTAISTALFVVLRDTFELTDISVEYLVAAGVATYLLCLLFATLTFAVGAATGSKGTAIAVGAGLATATYLIFALASFVDFFENVQWLSPWTWFLDSSALEVGFRFEAVWLPIFLIVPAVALGTMWFTRRDLR